MTDCSLLRTLDEGGDGQEHETMASGYVGRIVESEHKELVILSVWPISWCSVHVE